MVQQPIRVTVWHEHVHEKTSARVRKVYPDGMHTVMKDAIEQQLGERVEVRTALLEEPDHGLTDEVLANTDVMTWWGHAAHQKVEDRIVEKVHARVLDGMGFIALHSAHFSKPFKRLMGTGCGLKWREAAERERFWVVNPGHEIADGLGEHFELPHTEMYGEHFDIPQPDELIFISWFQGGEVFRSGCTWRRGKGKVFYFRPGHETFPIYYDEHVRRVLGNAVLWAAPRLGSPYTGRKGTNFKPLERIASAHEVDASLHQ
ncbi:MAG: ThuA domain-containing protein [Phycisphaeraceae bacterium]